MKKNKGNLAFFMLTGTTLSLALSTTAFADSSVSMITTAFGMLFLLVTVLVLFCARSNQKAVTALFISRARAPCKTVQNIRMNSKNTTFGISVKERLTKTIRLSSPWRQDYGRVVRC